MISKQMIGRDVQTILIVDDDQTLREHLTRAFQRRGFTVLAAACSADAMLLVQTERCDLAVIDLRMPGESGMKLLSDLRSHSPETKVLMLTGFGSIANAVEAIRLGAVNYVPKPAHADDILAAFTAAHDFAVDQETEVGEESPSLAQAQWEHIQRILNDCDGNISRAARRLGIARRSLQRKLRKQAPD